VWQADWQLENLERTVNMQVALAKDNISLNVKQIASCAESVRQAQRAYDIMKESFNIGAASYLDLRDAELALTQSRLTRYQAIYNYLLAGAELELLLGNAVPVNQTDNK
jgi:outer membrane protein TolC